MGLCVTCACARGWYGMLHRLRVRYSLSLGPALLSGSRGVHPLFSIYLFSLCVFFFLCTRYSYLYIAFPVEVLWESVCGKRC